jgi:hypothetical protein
MARIRDDALVPELMEQRAAPSRVGADFEHDEATFKTREELVECFLGRADLGPPEHRAFRVEEAQVAAAISEVASDDGHGIFVHGSPSPF